MQVQFVVLPKPTLAPAIEEQARDCRNVNTTSNLCKVHRPAVRWSQRRDGGGDGVDEAPAASHRLGLNAIRGSTEKCTMHTIIRSRTSWFPQAAG